MYDTPLFITDDRAGPTVTSWTDVFTMICYMRQTFESQLNIQSLTRIVPSEEFVSLTLREAESQLMRLFICRARS